MTKVIQLLEAPAGNTANWRKMLARKSRPLLVEAGPHAIFLRYVDKITDGGSSVRSAGALVEFRFQNQIYAEAAFRDTTTAGDLDAREIARVLVVDDAVERLDAWGDAIAVLAPVLWTVGLILVIFGLVRGPMDASPLIWVALVVVLVDGGRLWTRTHWRWLVPLFGLALPILLGLLEILRHAGADAAPWPTWAIVTLGTASMLLGNTFVHVVLRQ
jgi:hypothetical protein